MENKAKELLIKSLDSLIYQLIQEKIIVHDIADELLRQFEIKPIDHRQELRDEVNDILSTYVDFVPSGMIGAVMEAVDKYVATIQPKQPKHDPIDVVDEVLSIQLPETPYKNLKLATMIVSALTDNLKQ